MQSLTHRIHAALHTPQLVPKPFTLVANRTDIQKLTPGVLQEILDEHGHVFITSKKASDPIFTNWEEFNDCYSKFIYKPADYNQGTLKRAELENNVLDVGYHPPTFVTCQHNELAYAPQWPSLIIFGCMKAPQSKRGRTVLSNMDGVTNMMSDPLREKFERLSLMYSRNYPSKFAVQKDDSVYNLTWEDRFGSDSRDYVEQHLKETGYDLEWKSDGGLRTTLKCASFLEHPRKKIPFLFNQILMFTDAGNYSQYPGDTFIGSFSERCVAEEERPYYVFWGDGSNFSDEELLELAQLYQKNMAAKEWRKGDVLIIDNHAYSHGRETFAEGDDRVIGAMFGNPVERIRGVGDGSVDTCRFLD